MNGASMTQSIDVRGRRLGIDVGSTWCRVSLATNEDAAG